MEQDKGEQEANDATKLNPHPLYFPHILKKVFIRLNLRDLKSCRLVCSTWCAEATKLEGRNTIIRLETPSKLRMYVKDILLPFRADNESNQESRVYSIANAKNIHLCASTLILWYESQRQRLDLQNMTTDFIANYGDTVRTLDLDFKRIPRDKLEKILQSSNFKNLKKIIVHVEEVEDCFLNFSTWKFPANTEIRISAILDDEELEECKQIIQAQLLQTSATPKLNDLNI